MEKCHQWVQCDILQFLNHKIIASAFEAKNKMFVYKGKSALSQGSLPWHQIQEDIRIPSVCAEPALTFDLALVSEQQDIRRARDEGQGPRAREQGPRAQNQGQGPKGK